MPSPRLALTLPPAAAAAAAVTPSHAYASNRATAFPMDQAMPPQIDTALNTIWLRRKWFKGRKEGGREGTARPLPMTNTRT